MNVTNLLKLTIISLLLVSATVAQRVVSHDARFDKIVPKDAKLEKVADGFGWAEGPAWNYREGFLLISDVNNNSIFKIEKNGRSSLFLRPSGYTGTESFTGREPGSNGLTFDAEGRLVLNQHGDRRIVRLERDGTMTVLAARFEGKRLNSPNDLVYRSNGDLYFTDPPFGLPKVLEDPEKELDFQGVYRLSGNGQLTLLTKEVMFPNGIAFSPDEKTLYVSHADKKNAVWYSFEVTADGTLGEKRVIYDLDELSIMKPGVPDGLKVDKNGYLFAAAPGGIHVIDPSDGNLLGTFEFDAATANCAWGEDGSVLYITSNTAIYRIRLNTKGAAVGK